MSSEILLASLTIEEKISQMMLIDIEIFMNNTNDSRERVFNKRKFNDFLRTTSGIGAIFNTPFTSKETKVVGWNATQWRTTLSEIHSTYKLFISTKSAAFNKLTHISLLYGIDSVHGANYVQGATIFPHQIGIAATFNPQFAYLTGKITAKDTRAAGIPWIFAPVLDLALQPLWPRFAETFGEDLYLTSKMGTALIQGIQFVSDDQGSPRQAAACMKHFIGYSSPINGRDRSPVHLPESSVLQLYAPPFHAAVKSGDVLSTMESYQELEGIPMAQSSKFLKTLLRNQMNFSGVLVTDFSEINNLHYYHNSAHNTEEAVRLAMERTSIDMSMVPKDTSFFDNLLRYVNTKQIPVSRIDESVLRILQLKEKLGLLSDRSLSIEDPLVKTVGQDKDWELALNISRESITLLKNDQNILPILLSTHPNIFVTGRACHSLSIQSGAWTYHWQGARDDEEFTAGYTVVDGLHEVAIPGKPIHKKRKLKRIRNPNYNSDIVINYFPGPALDGNDLHDIHREQIQNRTMLASHIVYCISEEITSTEKLGEISDLNLPSIQREYMHMLHSLGKPIIVVIISGRPRILHNVIDQSSAILHAYQPGPMGGLAIAEVIVGRIVPSGRLPFTYPLQAVDTFHPYHHKTNDKCTNPDVTYYDCKTAWPFGFGLTYTTFTYSNLSLSQNVINETETLTVQVTIQNSGQVYTAKHTVLLYIYDIYRSVTPEYKLLKRFDKIYLSPNEKKTLSWSITSQDLVFIGENNRYILESGEYRIEVANDRQVDCREISTPYPSQLFNDSCKVFHLNVTHHYHPVCEHACQLWHRGICHQHKKSDWECHKECRQLKWDWYYLKCLEEFVNREELCPMNEGKCILSPSSSIRSRSDHVITPSMVTSQDMSMVEKMTTSSFSWFTMLMIAVILITLGRCASQIVRQFQRKKNSTSSED